MDLLNLHIICSYKVGIAGLSETLSSVSVAFSIFKPASRSMVSIALWLGSIWSNPIILFFCIIRFFLKCVNDKGDLQLDTVLKKEYNLCYL